ncbi:McrB family protein [Neobacillus drentensis]|uniref:McrB family protein n=1 Tax=Neobacillus drentensis TaxID=220684 RepID=UPI002FFD650F
MIQANQLIDIMNIEDTTLRNQRILDEVQPLARRIMDSFIAKYSERDSYLLQLKIHTYEQTLKTTIADSRNPKYADKKQHYGNKGFVELIDEKLYESPLFIIKLEFHLASREIRLLLSSDFYPFWVLSKRTQVHELERMIEELQDDIQIFTIEDKKNMIAKSEFTDTIWQYIKNKRKPTFYFGKILPLEGVVEEQDIIDQLWDTYQKLTPVRSVLENEAVEHSQGLLLMKNFQDDVNPIQIKLFSKTYDVKISEEVKKVKTNEYKQMFYIYDQDQLITDGHIGYFTRDPHESLGIFINNRGYIFHRIRKLATQENYEWFIKKAYYHRGKYNENNENQIYQEKTVEELKNHHFRLNDLNAYYVGTYTGNNEFFTEPISVIKERLILAAAIFADVRGDLTFPKGTQPPMNPGEDIETEEGDVVEAYSSSFDFTNIMDLVEQSGFTFSLDIIRDFYLNLTSLDDKHFVILSGISGTGKTQLCRVFANAVYGLDYSEDNPYLKIVPVRPDWMDATSLFGYYSSFEKRYMKTEFLEMLLQANEEKDKPHFIVLDEMNLARVEYYLSDYLSAVESRKPIQLHNIDDLKEVPKTIEIPHNFYVIGTINVDETTHSISDKVLDRSFVMTLSDVDFTSFWDRLDEKFKKTVRLEWDLLLTIHTNLATYDLHFGYRTMNEMIRKLYKNSMLPEQIRMEPLHALDRVVSEKVIPKIRGDERITGLLEVLGSLFGQQFNENSQAFKHIKRMREELERYGSTQFWR